MVKPVPPIEARAIRFVLLMQPWGESTCSRAVLTSLNFESQVLLVFLQIEMQRRNQYHVVDNK
jgi:hypothetical protein